MQACETIYCEFDHLVGAGKNGGMAYTGADIIRAAPQAAAHGTTTRDPWPLEWIIHVELVVPPHFSNRVVWRQSRMRSTTAPSLLYPTN